MHDINEKLSKQCGKTHWKKCSNVTAAENMIIELDNKLYNNLIHRRC